MGISHRESMVREKEREWMGMSGLYIDLEARIFSELIQPEQI